MRVINVPKFNDDGTVECIMAINPEEARELLQFAVNFLAGVGHHAVVGKPQQLELPLIDPNKLN